MFVGMLMMMVLIVWVNVAGTGYEETGSQSWIRIFGVIEFQPSEFAKLFVILYLAGSFYRKEFKRKVHSICKAK